MTAERLVRDALGSTAPPGGTPETSAIAAIEYPCSDGKPTAENDAQRDAIMYAIQALRAHFAHRPDVYVSGDLLIYYEQGNPRASVAPDTFVVLGAEKRQRQTYKLWEEPKAPDFALEVASLGEHLARRRGAQARAV